MKYATLSQIQTALSATLIAVKSWITAKNYLAEPAHEGSARQVLTTDGAGGRSWATFVGERGPQGERGPTGAQGVQGETGLQGPAGPQGTPGSYPLTTDSTSTAVTQVLAANEDYLFSAGLTSLTVTFGAALSGYCSEYRLRFRSGATAPTVSVPTSVQWSPATPVFEANHWYELAFLPLGDQFVGIWTAVEASA